MSNNSTRLWFAQRITGALLFLLLGSHFYIYHYFMGPGMWGFDSIGFGATDLETLRAMAASDPDLARYYRLAAIFANPVWKAFDVLLISLAAYHGFYGLLAIVDDWIGNPAWHRAAKWVVILLGLALWLTGVIAVTTFNPQQFALL